MKLNRFKTWGARVPRPVPLQGVATNEGARKMGADEKMGLPVRQALRDSYFSYAAFFAFGDGCFSGLMAFLAFSFAAKSCLILWATASVSTA